jgi:Mg2+-importing ATPase
MDPTFLEQPKRWNAKFLGLFMLIIGPVSSVFDITTFLLMWFYYGLNSADGTQALQFQTAWFIESLLTQVCCRMCV